jgi:hypothetical protein
MEQALLEFLVRGEWRGEKTARSQISSGRHGGEWGPGDPSFRVIVPAGAPRLEVSDGILPVSDRIVLDEDGSTAVGGVMLWVKDGRIDEFEYYRFDSEPATLPPTNRVTTWDDPRSIG